MYVELNPQASAKSLHVGIAVSRYHDEVTGRLCEGAVETFTSAGGDRDRLLIVPTPGSYELVAAAAALAQRGNFDAVVCLGCVITGETRHDEYICQAVSNGLAQITVNTAVPVTFGVLTCATFEQARERAGGDKGNKGGEAMAAAIEMANAIREIDTFHATPRGAGV